MTRPAVKKKTIGSVAFVGTGPGDPSLLTLRAVDALAVADVVVLDRMVRDGALVHAPAGVEVIDGSLGEDGAPLAHAARAKLVVQAAKSGRRVVRLMDGDPGTFNGLAEEAGACVKAGVPFEVVPGVSAVTAVPSYAGIPLTDAKARSVHIIPPHEATIDCAAHADAGTTLVVLGGFDRIEEVAQGLLACGRSGSTPVAVTEQGTTTAQRTVVATLATVGEAVGEAGLATPVITVIGPTVALREKLSWYETKPLFGWRVLVPRTKEQAGALSQRLRAYGAVPEEVPTIAVEPPRTPQQIERAIKGLVTGRYEWIAFTSRNAVRAVREKFEDYGLDARAFAGIKVAAVGEQTAADLVAWGIKPDLVPSGEQSAAGLLEEWPAYDSVLDPIDRVFLPRADIATETLVAGLRELGWEVDDVTAYRTVRAAPPPAPVREAIKGGSFDAVVFTSSSTVRNLVGIAGKPHTATVVACIGPQTAKTAEEHGLRVDVLAAMPSAEALAEALAEYGAAHRLAAIEAGEPVLRPSERRGGARRKAK
ncbi:MAG: bifunctional uroporphyrinogen-III C-methyltransferase/uroporphyrinogen-III synthase [Actinomycetota bacterium]|nr:bifunctional uroporphyrinogen-III C-methyltransferase/uroporphyrinogen-III synthase [Actinomycetota bacterium]